MYENVLKQYFGYDTFREGQSDTINSILSDKRDVLTILPTSTGKTLIYQLITIVRRNRNPNVVTVVISPLIALMIDQVNRWNRKFQVDDDGRISVRKTINLCDRRPVAILMGSAQEDKSIEDDAFTGKFPVVYTSPEKLKFIRGDMVKNVHLLVVDECHCISEHGNSFRPAYRNIRSFFPGIQTLALTATVTNDIRNDIVTNLGLMNPIQIQGSIYRKNLKITTHLKCGVRKQDVVLMKQYIRNLKGNGRCVVFVPTRNEAESIAHDLGPNAMPYHAGFTPDKRKRIADKFTRGTIVVATSCFGLGIDYPDIRIVFHYGLPRTILGYVQECGRAGRDDRLSECVLFYSATDLCKYSSDLSELNDAKCVLKWVQNDTICKQLGLLQHFGETSDITCGKCCVCCRNEHSSTQQKFKLSDIRLLLMAVKQTGNYSGKRLPIDFLLGSNSKKLKRFKKMPGSVHNHGRHLQFDEWVHIFNALVACKLIREVITNRGYVIYQITPSAKSYI